MKAKIEIDLNNDAFQPSAGPELARILRNLAQDLDDYPDALGIGVMDVNGNTVGNLEIVKSEDEIITQGDKKLKEMLEKARLPDRC